MITVDEVYPIDINTTIGPTGTIKRLFRNRDYFRQRGYEMTIFAGHPVKKKLLKYEYQLKEVTVLPEDKNSSIMPDTINKGRATSKIKSRIKKMIQGSRALSAWNIRRVTKDNKKEIEQYLAMDRHPDMIVFHEGDSCYHYYKLTEGRPHAKTAMFIHADGSRDSMFSKTYPKLMGTKTHEEQNERFDYAVAHCDRLVFITHGAKEVFLRENPGVEPDKIITFHNGIDDMPIVEVAPSSPYKYRLCCTGTVCERKGQYLIIEAMKQMRQEILKDMHVTIMGTGPDHSKLMAKVEEYGLQEHVFFAGNVPNKQVHEKLCAENIYILMSDNEGLPISILEAMRAGLPVISTKIAGIPEEVDDRNGVLINPDVKELTDVLNRLDQYDWDTLGKNSRRRFEEEFTFEIMRKNYADLFDNIK